MSMSQLKDFDTFREFWRRRQVNSEDNFYVFGKHRNESKDVLKRIVYADYYVAHLRAQASNMIAAAEKLLEDTAKLQFLYESCISTNGDLMDSVWYQATEELFAPADGSEVARLEQRAPEGSEITSPVQSTR